MNWSYSVTENTPGYLPDSDDAELIRDRRAAFSYAADLLVEYVDAVLEAGGRPRVLGVWSYGEESELGDHDDVIRAYVMAAYGDGDSCGTWYAEDVNRDHDLGRVVCLEEIAES